MDILYFFGNLNVPVAVARSLGYGLAVAAVAAFFVTGTARKAVGAILSAKALSKDEAKTAEELRLTGPFVRRSLRDGSSLRKTVRKTEDGRFFIPEEEAYRAEIRYVKRNSPVAWIVGIVLLAAATEAAARLLPWMLGLFG